MAGPRALVVPELPIGELDGLVEGGRRQQTPLIELAHDPLGRDGELGVEELDDGIELLHEGLGEGLSVALLADQVHGLTAPLRGDDRLDLARAPVRLADLRAPLGGRCTGWQLQLVAVLQHHQQLTLGNRTVEAPGAAQTHVMGGRELAGRPHVTGHAGGGRGVFPPGDPLGGIEAHSVLFGHVDHAVLGRLEDLLVRRVGARVAAHAGLRLPGLGLGEAMTAVTGGARPLGAVGIDAPDPRVGPGGGVEGPVALHLDPGSVALVAAGRLHGGPGEVVRQGRDPLLDERVGLRVDRPLLLLEFLRMATAAVLGRDDGGDHLPLVLPGIRLRRIRLMAVHTVHAGLLMGTLLPLLGEARGRLGVAAHTVGPRGVPPLIRRQLHLGGPEGRGDEKRKKHGCPDAKDAGTPGGLGIIHCRSLLTD